MRKLSQKGFGVVEVLIIFVVLGLIGGAGFYVWQKSKNNSQTINSNNSANQSKSNDSKSYTFDTSGLTKIDNLGGSYPTTERYESGSQDKKIVVNVYEVPLSKLENDGDIGEATGEFVAEDVNYTYLQRSYSKAGTDSRDEEYSVPGSPKKSFLLAETQKPLRIEMVSAVTNEDTMITLYIQYYLSNQDGPAQTSKIFKSFKIN